MPEAPGTGPAIVPERSGFRPAGFNGPAASTPTATTARATVVVRLPADARLYADGAPLRLTGAERTFVTPELPAGMEYTYRLTAEYERGGEVVSVTRKVAVRAGGMGSIEFTDLTAARPTSGLTGGVSTRSSETPASPVSTTPSSSATPIAPIAPVAPVIPSPTPGGVIPSRTQPTGSPQGPDLAPATGRATITVRMPAGASLYVDDRRSPSVDPVRRFTTPPLPAGREFAYLLKAEIVRSGQPEQLIQKITFKAGEQVVVDFTSLGTGR